MKKPSWFVLALVAVLAVAAALRLWRLPDLPPGLWYDEAINGVDVRMVLSGQGLPLYFAANTGREPLFIYLQALSVALLGPSPFSLRLVSALIGIATVAAVYACGRALTAPVRPSLRVDPRWPAALAAAILAVTYWHLSLSRLGLRAVLLPLLSAFAMLAFWRAWTGGRARDYPWAGFWFGLSLYTYTSARVLPLVPALFLITEVVAARLRSKTTTPGPQSAALRWRGLLVAIFVGLLVTAPLLVELARHPVTVIGRVGDVAASEANEGGNALASIASNSGAMLRAFYDRGDPNPRHNLPGRGATDPLSAALFTAGLLLALLRIADSRARLLLIWFAVMLLPSILSGAAPHYLRAAGSLPPFALLAGWGGAVLAALVPARISRWLMPGLLALVLVGGGFLTTRDYFIRWPAEPALVKEFSVEQQAAAERAAAILLRPGSALELPDALYRTPQMVYRLGPLAEQADAATAPGATPVNAGSGAPVWQLTSDGQAVSARLARPNGAAWQPEVPLDLAFANGMRLVGYDIYPPVTVEPSSPITLTLYWLPTDALTQEAAASSEVFAHLVVHGAVRATDNGPLGDNYRLVWPALRGLLIDTRVFSPPPDAPAGKAHFEVGQYARKPWESYEAVRRIPLIDAAGNAAGDQVVVAPVMLAAPPPAADLTALAPLSATFEARIALVGWRVTAESGASAMIARFCWRAERRLPTDLTAFVHLLDAADAIVSQFDAAPGGTNNPTSRWVPGETVCTEHPLTLPAAAALDDFRLRVGLYEPVSGRQWSVAGPGLVAPASYLILRPEEGR